jgi:hypothetical protein
VDSAEEARQVLEATYNSSTAGALAIAEEILFEGDPNEGERVNKQRWFCSPHTK